MSNGPLADYNKGKLITPAFVDGLLYMAVAVLAAMYAVLSSDDSAKFISPQTLFWLKFYVGGANAGVLALKMYRSTGYADSKKQQTNGETK